MESEDAPCRDVPFGGSHVNGGAGTGGRGRGRHARRTHTGRDGRREARDVRRARGGAIRSRLVCAVLMNSDTLIANYGVKQSQFTKPISELPR